MRRTSNESIRRPLAALLVLALGTGTGSVGAQALTPAFTYQGELRLTSGPANGSFDLQFRLYDALAGGSQIGPLVSANAVVVTGGLFAVPLDFGPAQFAGERQFLEIAIRPAGSGTFETLSPRTEVTAAPYAWSAAVALANSVTTTSIVDGTIGSVDINAAQVQRRVTGNCAVGQYVRAVAQDGTVTCGTDANSGGTVTSIATGTGLSGGPITASGTISVAPGGIGAAQINSAEVQRRVTGTCTGTNYVQQVNADGTVGCGPVPSGWSLTGNAGTTAATNFLGTTDGQPLVFRVANQPALRIEPNEVSPNLIGGFSGNAVAAGVLGATIGGGGQTGALNRVTDDFGTIGGGRNNRAGNDASPTNDQVLATVGGGFDNIASGSASTVGGGFNNVASGVTSTIGGGQRNTASGSVSTVGGGFNNIASAIESTVGGGSRNTASGRSSTVSGGENNCAGGQASWAAGGRAKVRPATDPGGAGSCSGLTYPGGSGDQGTFVWADSQALNFVSTGENQFLVRAQGGAVITGSSNVNDPLGNRLRVNGTLRVDTLGAAGSAALCRNAENQLASCSSSARYKQDIADLELGLATALRLNAVGYRWKEGGTADLGFVAEEIAAIDERLVTRNDQGEVEGVKYERLTAVLANALQELVIRQEAEREALRAEVAAIRSEISAMRSGRSTSPPAASAD